MNTYTERFKKYLVDAAFSTCPHDGRKELWDMGIDHILERGIKEIGATNMLNYLDKLFEEAQEEYNNE